MRGKALIAEWDGKAYRVYRDGKPLACISEAGLNELAEWAREHGYYVLEIRL